MHLKSLTLKGFKSFASSTTMRFEPGITAIVGPNGSGKSNVVDAMAWVLGEQGAKALRGGKMDDVIFAGTSSRPPLGRAEVTLTIDNRDGALPIDYDEVSLTRRMFRDGAGEYEINGKACRLLDIQELLSDSGIGRELHVIVGQGHLDAVLSARPEDRRAFIEEAAGVLKHRKRKEKALRKLDAMQANLTRLTDLTTELRRQLGPLGRQAEIARRAAGVQADLRDARLRLLADDLAGVQAAIDADEAAEAVAAAHRQELQRKLAEATEAGERAAADLAEATPALAESQGAHLALTALVERFRGMTSLATERASNLAVPLAVTRQGRDPEELLAEAAKAEQAQAELDRAVDEARRSLSDAVGRRAAVEASLAAADAELAAAARAQADRREGLALLAGQVGSARSRLVAGEEESQRLAAAISDATERARVAEHEFEQLRDSIDDLDSSEIDLDGVHEAAVAEHEAALAKVSALTARLSDLTSAERALAARVEALSLGIQHRDGAATLLADAASERGVIGSLASVLTVQSGAEAAIAAALGAAADAVVVDSLAAAVGALLLLKDTDGGRAGLVLAGAPDGGERPTTALPQTVTWAVDQVSYPPELTGAIRVLLGNVVIVPDLSTAETVVSREPNVVAVTVDGDVLGRSVAHGGSRSKQTAIEIQAAITDAERELREVNEQREATADALTDAVAVELERRTAMEATLAALHESDARIAAVSEQLAHLGSVARAAAAEVERLRERSALAEAASIENSQRVADLEARLAAAESDDAPPDIDAAHRHELASQLEAERNKEVEARLALRTAEERAASSAGSAERLRRAAAAERAARTGAEQEAARRVAAARLAEKVATTASQVLARLQESVDEVAARRSADEQRRAEAEAAASTARRELAELQREWDALSDSTRTSEVLRAQQRMRRDQLVETAAAEFSLTPAELQAEYGPETPVPPSSAEVAEYEAARERGDQVSAPIPMPFDRPSTERRAARAQRDLAALGRVNPLALEEFAAMEERHAFLSTQLEDLRRTRTDLLDVVEQVDAKILELFTEAYHDVAAEFVTVFGTLFPGGEGSLQLTDPNDMLTTGIEVLARPPGKKVKRLSLLSGGERSLVAVAMLVAIFRARPSPFYVLDEVEAALDEVNLTRLVRLLRELKTSSQLLIITHQKYTMEAADVLYGVSMHGDGISQVISQRVELAPALPREQGHDYAASTSGTGGTSEKGSDE